MNWDLLLTVYDPAQ